MIRTAWEVAADLIDSPGDDWTPQPHQIPPPGNWFGWLLLGGRGAGKTEATSHHFWKHINGPPCIRGVPGGHWPSIIAPTLGDGITSCVNGPSGLRKWDPGVKALQRPGGAVVLFPNGVEAKIFGAHTPEDVERLRSGGNRCIAWLEELAAWRYMEECFQHMRYGLRVGPRPHWVASTTPKNKTLIKKLVNDALYPETPAQPEVVISTATTDDNPHLPEHIRKMLYRDYAHTRLGQQELYAKILEDVEGALWTPAIIDSGRIPVSLTPTFFNKLTVAVDPPASATGDECGINVAGMLMKWTNPDVLMPDASQGFVLADESIQGTPEKWATKAVAAYRDWGANLIVAEVNNGGDMVAHTIHTIDPTIYVHQVHATRGKAKRAEPIVSLYEQDRVHHVGAFGKLEDQMTTWDQDDPPDDWSPDRMDALVWNIWHLMVGGGTVRSSQPTDSRLRGRR